MLFRWAMDRSSTLKAGDIAPEFQIPDEMNEPVSLRELARKGPVALLFFPSVWGMMCNVEMGTFRDMFGEFQAAGGQLIAITTNSPMSNAPYREHMRLPYQILSDFDGRVSGQYGILCGEEGYLAGRSNRAVFIVERDLRLKYVWVADDPAYEPDYDLVLKLLTEVAKEG